MTELSVETFTYGPSHHADVKTAAVLCNMVEVTVHRPYGCVVVRVTNDTVVVESQDGDGTAIEQQSFKLDDLVCDGETDPDDVLDNSLKALDGVPAELSEAGMGENPNPLPHGEPEGQEAGREEEGAGQARPEEGGGPAGGRAEEP
jgi:hypothetical protein